MAKNLIQDVILNKSKKPAVVNEPVKREKIPQGTAKITTPEENVVKDSPVFQYSRYPRRPRFYWLKNKNTWWSLGGIILVVGIIYILGAFFSEASIEITERTDSLPVNIQMTAKKIANSELPFEVSIVKGSETKSVVATGTKNIERKASGRVVIYNNYGTAPQRLIKNTRFEASNGKIYRIANEITVPGAYKKNGETIPGSVETIVYAEAIGPAYNQGLTDFTIPGFKGDSRYSKFYARSKTELSGGYSGTAPIASAKDTAAAKVAIETSLRGDLLHEASSQVPAGYILYKDATNVSFEEVNENSDKKSVVIKENGTLLGVLLLREKLLGEIKNSLSAKAKDATPFRINSIEMLSFVFQNPKSIIDTDTKEISFTLTGKVDVTYIVDKESLSKDLAGKGKQEFQSILAKYPSVYKARIISINPFWARYFPNNPGKININVVK